MVKLIIPESLQNYARVAASIDIDIQFAGDIEHEIQRMSIKLHQAIYDDHEVRPYVRFIYKGALLEMPSNISIGANEEVEIITSLVGG